MWLSQYKYFLPRILKVIYALGYTRLGVGVSRFGVKVLLDLMDDKKTERSELQKMKS